MSKKEKWRIRRLIINNTLLFCAACIVYLLAYGEDNKLHETIANGVIFLAGSVIGSYIFGATWDDKNAK